MRGKEDWACVRAASASLTKEKSRAEMRRYMNEMLYHLMDWPAIETLVYSEEDMPRKILGPHKVEEGILIQGFFPGASKVEVITERKSYEMELADEAGFYAVLLPGKKIPAYQYRIAFEEGEVQEFADPYAFDSVITEDELKKFNAGILYDAYEKLGAHPMTIKGVEGVLFAVWAPMAIRVSVVGDFNCWDGRRHPMQRLGDSGVFELFIPGLKTDEIYKYEIKTREGLPMLKADPYANYAQLRPDTASIICDLSKFSWDDEAWLKKRKATDYDKQPVLVYEMHLGSFKKPEDGREFFNYRELAPMVADYIKEMGYTHIELMPVMEHPFDASWGYQVTGYYAPTSRYGTPEDFMYFINYLHQREIGVILDWVPAHFPRDAFGLACFDGTCLYEHRDPRQGSHPHWGTLIYNYKRPEVSNFLIANALFWAEKYHVDGIRMDAVASMLYLDYGKNDGEWIPNIYGGKENLDAVEFLKHLNSIFQKREKGVMLIAEESTAWPKITGNVEDDGLGFQYKWNMGWMNDTLEYMRYDPYFRSHHYNLLTFSMIYAYSEKFMLSLSHDEVVHEKGSLIGKMPGATLEEKASNLRVLYGWMMTHPGKKLLFMGQDIAQISEWSEERGIDWGLLSEEPHRQMKEYVKALNRLYLTSPALYQADFETEGFEWINCISANENILIYLRKSAKKEDTLLVVCNFTPLVYENHKIGVPFRGKYKEIFNSNQKIFGGDGEVNPRLKQSKKDECDGREDSITVKVPSMGVAIFQYIPVEEEQKGNKAARSKTSASEKRSHTGKAQVEKIRQEMMAETVLPETGKKPAAKKTSGKKTTEKKSEEKKTKKK